MVLGATISYSPSNDSWQVFFFCTFSLIMSYNMVRMRVRRTPTSSALNNSDRIWSPPRDRKWPCAYGKWRSRDPKAKRTWNMKRQTKKTLVFIFLLQLCARLHTFFLTCIESVVASRVNNVCKPPLSTAFTWTTGLLQMRDIKHISTVGVPGKYGGQELLFSLGPLDKTCLHCRVGPHGNVTSFDCCILIMNVTSPRWATKSKNHKVVSVYTSMCQ